MQLRLSTSVSETHLNPVDAESAVHENRTLLCRSTDKERQERLHDEAGIAPILRIGQIGPIRVVSTSYLDPLRVDAGSGTCIGHGT